jgi:sugar phosphate isomerase/epimerase
MRLGGPIFRKYDDPETWTIAVKALGYRAAYCPVGLDADDATVRAYEQAAHDAGIVIAEVGAWSNPMGPNPESRAAALDKCKRSLDLADRIGARCCVNITGSRGEKWDGPHANDLTEETFDMIVATTREIIDAVRPRRTFYTLEMMQWTYPDSPDSYLRLLQAIDRTACAVHLDPVNLINSPGRYFNNASLIHECFAKLGSRIRSCHAKDVILHNKALVHLDEVRPGLGKLDYEAYLDELNQLDGDTPLMLEHLPDAGEYTLAAQHIRSVAERQGYAL